MDDGDTRVDDAEVGDGEPRFAPSTHSPPVAWDGWFKISKPSSKDGWREGFCVA